MIVDFSKIDLHDLPMIVLKNASELPLGVLGAAIKINADIKYNEMSVLNFIYPAYIEKKKTPLYQDIVGMRILDLKNIGQFILMNPKENGDGIQLNKTCKAYSLEYEFTFKKITLENDTYNFWNPVTPDSTILGIILEKMPSWSIGFVDSSLIGKYRTFDVSNENLYNFMKNKLQKSYGCIFEFDTYNRVINVHSVETVVPTNTIYLSTDNLLSEILIEEDTEKIVTQLDVTGADGVDIRDVNPTGTNKIINLDYYMTTTNFSQDIIDKYYNWKETYESYQTVYYYKSIEYSMKIMQKTTETAALTDLEGELSNLENQQAVIIQGIAQNLKDSSDLTEINNKIAVKQNEINEKMSIISSIKEKIESILNELKEINAKTNFKNAFTEDEYIIVDRFIKEDSLSESSFVIQETDTYSKADHGDKISSETIYISASNISVNTNSDTTIYEIREGTITIGNIVSAKIIRGVFERKSSGQYVFTVYLNKGTVSDDSFDKASISMSGSCGDVSFSDTFLNISDVNGYLFLSYNTSEYTKRSVSWDLYEYGNSVLEKVSQPSFKFSITSANFLYSKDFIKFKNALKHGEKLYLGLPDDQILTPIVIGVKLDYDASQNISLEFSDTYSSGDSSFKLKDLLDQSISMGNSLDLSKFSYSAFVDSGANTGVKEFMTSALDVAKNAIISSKNQAISWGDSGIRLRKWKDESKTEYDDHQVWMNNNSILMTSNNWTTAELAIGEFYDKNLGIIWGMVAPNIVGTLLAGSSLVIESAKEHGGVAVFKVDAEGASLHNASFNLYGDSGGRIDMGVIYGIVGGSDRNNLFVQNNSGVITGVKTNKNNSVTKIADLDSNETPNANFWLDMNGDLYLKGFIDATDGVFRGSLEVGGATAFRVDSNGNLKIGGTTTNPNFSVDSNGNLMANQGTFKGTIYGAVYKDSYGYNMMNSREQFTADYLNLLGINVGNGSFVVDNLGNVTVSGSIQMGAGSSINWAQTRETNIGSSYAYQYADDAYGRANSAYNLADIAYDNAIYLSADIQALVDGTYSGGSFINGTTIYSPTLVGGNIVWGTDGVYGHLYRGFGYDGVNNTDIVEIYSNRGIVLEANTNMRFEANGLWMNIDADNIVVKYGGSWMSLFELIIELISIFLPKTQITTQ